MQLKTKQGYDFYEVASSLQKAIRRADVETSGFFALELFHSGFDQYCWKRLLTVSAEDCAGIITQEIKALYDSYNLINVKSIKGGGEKKGRIFISKAVIVLCESIKSRDADHLSNYVYDKKKWVNDETINNYFEAVRSQGKLDVPEYAFDVHTQAGRRMGKSKADFFKEEEAALTPKRSNDLFAGILDE